MKLSRVRFVTLMQLVAAAVMSMSLALPVTAEAASSKTDKSVRSKAAASSAERSKRTTVAKQSARSGKKELSAKGKQSSKAVRMAQADLRGSKRKLAKSSRLAKSGRSSETKQARAAQSSVRLVALQRSAVRPVAMEPRSSIGDQMGLRAAVDPLDLNSSVALVVDQQTNEVLFSKNDSAVLPIASLTKLMTGLVVTDANLPLDEMVTITSDDVDTVKGSRSRLAVGTTLTRLELMHLALMSSENRAAHALGRTYPGGLDQFVRLMNAKARELGMRDTRYVEPTGLSSLNQSSARDLATLVSVAYQRPLLRSLSTSPSHQLELGHRTLEFRNSNRLIRDPDWDIGLQKTGYISEAGRCLVMQARVAGRQLIMVFLDATGKLGRAQDAERVRRWVEAQPMHQAMRPQG
ncbi:D-alanyl-D-alanine endopeptidase [Hydrogenophaga pseudoflava]|uniref:D-alanyl-D-alanine endopeptidase n=1 Tax=Hydrogenophaga pseudoflava TaxID=47421 RepID=UPI0027E564D4|nr:D-alanyl-D-alanine endopeptidase [Hydrogenophaga pseudoflava]MDQ7744351.1 D-alanyl-D-alanine endopeptidase [Hydrogenophaga pseudoflava]